MKKKGLLANGLIWFGAATSLAEIEAGISCQGNLIAVLLGHLLGFLFLFAMGAIGGQMRQMAMQTTAEAFGTAGSRIFAGLNMLQLVGWTAVMISIGARTASTLLPQLGFNGFCLVVGGLAIGGLIVDFRHATVLSSCTIVLLALLAAFLTVKLLLLPETQASATAESFTSAFELSVAMPLSWLPLISDHTRDAERPVATAFVSALVYSLVGVWMYVLGMMIASADVDNSVAQAILRTGIGVAGLAVVILSTSLSAFLDLYSSAESGQTLWHRLPPKAVGLTAGALGIVLALCGIQDRYAGFLYLIASVFAPMSAVLLVSHYIVRKQRVILNSAAWLVGFITYQFAGDSPLGPTLTAVLVSAFIASLGKIK